MKISYNWLKEFVSLENISPVELANKLTEAGLEIEDVSSFASGSNLVIGEVKKVIPHPDSDHLNIAMVDYGEGEVQIVCGAPNLKNNIKVIVAKVGAVLPEITIKKGNIRGIESNGMLCALFELGIDKKFLSEEDSTGIKILDDDAPVGQNPLKYLGLDDYILDASQTPNRADCMAMWSVAKEVGAVLRRKASLPVTKHKYNALPSTLILKSETDRCPLVLGKIINKIEIKPSPEWMVNYLQASGVKSINNVVDISNYVMLETGQPLHFYDANKFIKKEITVVNNLEENITLLDGETYKLEKNDLVIRSNNESIGLAGIMGGESSKIDDSTTAIIIESALFNRVSIRNTANRLGINTEASSRFIKGLEPLSQIKAMERAVDLLIEYASAEDIEETVQVGEIDYKPVVVKETLEHCNARLGTNFKLEEVISVLEALDLKVEVDGNSFTCTIPSYRTDLVIPEDLDEEIIRLIGYDSLNATLPTMVATIGQLDESQKLERLTKTVMTSLGLSEIVTYSLVKEDYVNNAFMPFGSHVKLASPLSDDRKYVRNSLINSMLECVSYNANRKANSINLFEISNVYEENQMQKRLSIALSTSLQSSRLHKIDIKADFFVLKGIVEEYLDKCGIVSGRYSILKNDIDINNFHPYRSAKVMIQDELFGVFGEIHPLLAKKLGLDRVIYGEFRIDVLENTKISKMKFIPLDKYPSVSRDIALIVDKNLEVNKILKVINSNSGKIVKSLEVFDVYTGEHVADDKKSVALNIIYQSKDKTLTDADVAEVHNNIITRLKEELNAVLRS